MEIYEISPTDGRASFYGKCRVWNIHGKKYLQSYETFVMFRDENGNFHRTYGGFSATTGRHIKAFSGMNKKAFLSLPLEKLRLRITG